MNNKIMLYIRKGVLPILLIFIFSSCRNSFDILPKDALGEEEAYSDVNDADAAIIGIYGELLNLSGKYVILNGLRGDLMDVTNNADKYLRAINLHHVTDETNLYTNPRPFYKVILDCNDAIHHFDIMLRENKLTNQEYDVRYSAVGAVRSWLYLELGIQY